MSLLDPAVRAWRQSGRGADSARPRSPSISTSRCASRSCRSRASDKLEDTVCYADLIEAARARVAGREFKLVERLAHELYGTLRPLVPPGAELALRVTKLHPPVAELAGGVSFALGDFEI
jgi:dihydroneopterin aldolase